jgi:replicative superfamily II helicase
MSPPVDTIMKYGVGVHHAGHCQKDRDNAQWLFNKGALQFLCTTTTLSAGVCLACLHTAKMTR